MEVGLLLNVVDGCIPSDLGTGTSAEIEEERRLLYVAMTRAKDDLHLIVPQRFFIHGQSAGRPARLRLADALHSRKTARPVRADGLAMRRRHAARATSQGPKLDIGARTRGMWR